MPGEKEFQEAYAELTKPNNNIDYALEKLHYSANHGFVPSYVWLHIIYSTSCLNQFDISQANKWKKFILLNESIQYIQQEAVSKNQPSAKLLLGYLHHFGIGVEKNAQLAIGYYDAWHAEKYPEFFSYLRADVYHLKGKAEYDTGHYRQALKSFNQANKINKNYLPAFFWRGITYSTMAERLLQQGKIRGDGGSDQLFNRGITYLKICLHHNNKNADLHYRVSEAYFHLEQYKLALRYLENALELEGNNIIYQQKLSQLKTRLQESKQKKPNEDDKKLTSKADNIKDSKYEKDVDLPIPLDRILDGKDKLSSSIGQNHHLPFFHSNPPETKSSNQVFEYHPEGGIISIINEKRILPDKNSLCFACKINENATLDWQKTASFYLEGLDTGTNKGFFYRFYCNEVDASNGTFIVESELVDIAQFRQEHYQIYLLKDHIYYLDSIDGMNLMDTTKTTEFHYHSGFPKLVSDPRSEFNLYLGLKIVLKSMEIPDVSFPSISDLPTTLDVDHSKTGCLIL